ncbi:polysaccharide deacetylase family protein [Ornithinimicrobium panacihumi]|uniref:polysaccharide deacetylase family protein n=1 Tax=Ornithinimicrobium panacihumi TaxID=2008449 RepID=UPI003F8919E9
MGHRRDAPAPGGPSRRAVVGLLTSSAATLLAAPRAEELRGFLRADLPGREETVGTFAGRRPSWFGLEGPGIISTFDSPDEVVLTFDACSGSRLELDVELLTVLRQERVPATLFLTRPWMLANADVVSELAADPLFELANHGDRHLPLTVEGQDAYGIAGTADAAEAYNEIARGHRILRLLWGRRSRWFRPGTAHADDVGVAIASAMGTPMVGFSVNADLGATATADQVAANLLTLQPGGIALAHINRPGSGTAVGTREAVRTLRSRGLRPRRLGDVLPA